MPEEVIKVRGNKAGNSDMARMLQEASILFGITLVAGILLGFVYELTKEPIRLQQEKAIQAACIAVFPGAEEKGIGFEELDYVPEEDMVQQLGEKGVTVGTVFAAKLQDGTLGGYVVEAASSEGYGGNIVLYVGVDAQGTVGGVSILNISETAGLGMEAPNVLVPQFAGRQVEQFSYTKAGSRSDSEVDAISGATITTKAVVNAVNGGLTVARELLEENGAAGSDSSEGATGRKGSAGVQMDVASSNGSVGAQVDVASSKGGAVAPVDVASSKGGAVAPVDVASSNGSAVAPVDVASRNGRAGVQAGLASSNGSAEAQAGVTEIADGAGAQANEEEKVTNVTEQGGGANG